MKLKRLLMVSTRTQQFHQEPFFKRSRTGYPRHLQLLLDRHSSPMLTVLQGRCRGREKQRGAQKAIFQPHGQRWPSPSSTWSLRGGEEFLIMDHSRTLPKPGKLWIFASPFALGILKNSVEWYLDGTFDVVKFTLFSQVKNVRI